MMVDRDKVTALIADVAAEIIAPKFRNLARADVRTKSGPNDLVTAVDEAAEKALEEGLSAILPDAAFVGEERAARDPGSLAALSDEGAVWVVDPIDGTRNFVNGVEEFATIVALVEGGRTHMGWIYAIPERACAVAVEGEGAAWNDAPLSLKRPGEKLCGLRSIGWLEEEWRERVRANLAAHFETRAGHCSAYAYLHLSRGEVDFKVSSRIHPWDHLAGALLLSEAGGSAAFLDTGEPLEPIASADRPLLAVAPARDWEAIAQKLCKPASAS